MIRLIAQTDRTLHGKDMEDTRRHQNEVGGETPPGEAGRPHP
jgi:hypothetical protein